MWGISRSGGESLGFLTRSGVRPKACLPVLSLLLLPASFLGAATAPVVDSLSATPSTVAPGGTVTIAVAAHDPDCTTPPCTTGCGQYVRADLTLWSASDGTLTAWDNGTSGSPYAASASWQAPAVEGSYLVTVQLSDSGSFLCGDRQTTLASLPVQVSTVINLPPVIATLTAQPALIFPGGSSQLACAATDPEGQPLDFAWASDLGTVSGGEGGAATFTAPAPGLATVTCTASDPDGGVASASVPVSISAVRVERTLEGPFVAPQRLALDTRGRLWVADRGTGGLVEVELASGAPRGFLARAGIEAVAADWNDDLLVAAGGHAEVIGADGTTRLVLEPGEDLGEIADVAVDAAEQRYLVLHRRAARVLVFDATGAPVTAFGATGDGPADLRAPSGLAITPAGQIVVADSGHARLQFFTRAGEHVFSAGGPGGGVGEFVELDDVAADADGVLYASDTFQSWVQTFYPDGTPREALGGYGSGAGQLKTPTGLAASAAFGTLAVASLNAARIELFHIEPSGGTPAPAGVFTPASLDFPPQEVGVPSAPRDAVLANAGNGPLALGEPALSGDFAASHDCPPALLPGESCAFHLRAVPAATGPLAGSLALASNLPEPLTLALSGSGFERPVLALTPVSLEFPEQPVGTMSAPLPVTLVNTGPGTLSLLGMTVSGPFVAWTGCEPTLPVAASCEVSVAFSPTVAGAVLFGTLEIESDAAGAPHVVALLGSSVDPRPLVVIGDVELEEGDEGTRQAVFPVTLSFAPEGPVAVAFGTASGSAVAGTDFEPAQGRLDFVAGQTAGEVRVAVLGDRLLEDDEEEFFVDLSAPDGVTLGGARGTAVLLDDESCPGPNLLVNGGAEEFPVGGAFVGWQPSGGAWVRRLADPDPDPELGDGRAYFAPAAPAGVTELVQVVPLGPYAERIATGRQEFWFSGLVRTDLGDLAALRLEFLGAADEVLEARDWGGISSPGVWALVEDVHAAPPKSAAVRVRLIARSGAASEGTPAAWYDALELRSLRAQTVSLGEARVYEGDAGTTAAAIPVALACAEERELSATAFTADGAAIAGEDYLPAGGTVLFAPGATAASVEVTVLGDTEREPHEDVVTELQLAAWPPAVSLVARQRVLIVNDDACAHPVSWWHRAPALPEEYLLLGGLEYGPAAVRALLAYGAGNLPTRVAQELAAARLNLAVGTPPSVLASAAATDTWLAVWPPGSSPTGTDADAGLALARRLADYNAGPCWGGSDTPPPDID